MNHSNQRRAAGFTLMEVVLAVSLGLIIIIGATVGYRYAKRSAMIKQQQDMVQAIKAFVDRSIEAKQAAGLAPKPPTYTSDQWSSIVTQFPTGQNDPYLGSARTNGCVAAACYESMGTQSSSPVALGPIAGNIGPRLQYYPGSTFKIVFTVAMHDGTTRTYYGYTVLDTDASGNVVAAAGGDTALQNLSN